MPVLPLPDDLSLARKASWLTAHMEYPDSVGIALMKFARDLVMKELNHLKPDQEVTLPVQWVRALAAGPLIEDKLEGKIDRIKAGTTAGLVLCLVFVMARGGDKAPSLNKAAHVIEHIAEFKREEGFAVTHYAERAKILKSWSLMRNVAHFWAAFEFLQLFAPDMWGNPGEKNLRPFLGYACTLRQFACKFRPDHKSTAGSLMDEAQSLSLPEEIEEQALPVESILIPSWMQLALNSYRAPKAL